MDDAHASREGIEQALYSLLPTGLAGVDAARGRARLRTLMTLRWLAVGGQTVASSSISGWVSMCHSAPA